MTRDVLLGKKQDTRGSYWKRFAYTETKGHRQGMKPVQSTRDGATTCASVPRCPEKLRKGAVREKVRLGRCREAKERP